MTRPSTAKRASQGSTTRAVTASDEPRKARGLDIASRSESLSGLESTGRPVSRTDLEPPQAVRFVTPGVEVPLGLPHHDLVRVNDPRGRLGRSGAEIIDLDLLERGDRRLERGERRRSVHLDGKTRRPEHGLKLRKGACEVPLRVGTGHSEKGTGGRGKGKALFGRETARVGELAQSLSHDPVLVYKQVDQLIGRVRRHTATSHKLEVVQELARTDRKTRGELSKRGFANSCQVNQDGEQAIEAIARRRLRRRQ